MSVPTLSEDADLKTQVDKVLGFTDGDNINISYALLRLLEQADEAEQPVLLQYIVDRWDARSSSGEIRLPQMINSNELEDFKRDYGPLVDRALDVIMAGNPTDEDFYQELNALVHNPILKDEKVRAFALYWTLIDPRIPYFQLERGLRLSAEDWKQLGEKLRKQREKVTFILASTKRFEQRSEESDLILKELDALEGTDRVRLMGFLMWALRDMDRKFREASEILK